MGKTKYMLSYEDAKKYSENNSRPSSSTNNSNNSHMLSYEEAAAKNSSVSALKSGTFDSSNFGFSLESYLNNVQGLASKYSNSKHTWTDKDATDLEDIKFQRDSLKQYVEDNQDQFDSADYDDLMSSFDSHDYVFNLVNDKITNSGTKEISAEDKYVNAMNNYNNLNLWGNIGKVISSGLSMIGNTQDPRGYDNSSDMQEVRQQFEDSTSMLGNTVPYTLDYYKQKKDYTYNRGEQLEAEPEYNQMLEDLDTQYKALQDLESKMANATDYASYSTLQNEYLNAVDAYNTKLDSAIDVGKRLDASNYDPEVLDELRIKNDKGEVVRDKNGFERFLYTAAHDLEGAFNKGMSQATTLGLEGTRLIGDVANYTFGDGYSNKLYDLVNRAGGKKLTADEFNALSQDDKNYLIANSIYSVDDYNAIVEDVDYQYTKNMFRKQETNREFYDMESTGRDYYSKSLESYAKANYGLDDVPKFINEMFPSVAGMAEDALVNAAIPGAGLANMFLRTYSDSYNEAMSQDTDMDTARLYGLAHAVIETATEKIGDSSLFNKIAYSSNDVSKVLLENIGNGKLLKILARGQFEEGIEEVAAEVLDPLAEAILASDWGQEVVKLYGEQTALQYIKAYASGALLSIVGSGAAVGKAAVTPYNGNAQSMVNQVLKYGDNKAQAYANKLQAQLSSKQGATIEEGKTSPRGITQLQAGKLYTTMQSAYDSYDTKKLTDYFDSYLTDLGAKQPKGTSQLLAEELVKASNKGMSIDEAVAKIESEHKLSQNVKDVLESITSVGENIKVDENIKVRSEYYDKSKALGTAKAFTDRLGDQRIADAFGVSVEEVNEVKELVKSASESAGYNVTGDKANAAAVDSVLQNADVTRDEAHVADNPEMLGILSKPLGKDADVIVRNYKEGQMIDDYVAAMNVAINILAANGATSDQIKAYFKDGVLTDNQMLIAHTLGHAKYLQKESLAKKRGEALKKAREAKAEKAEIRKGKVSTDGGSIVDNGETVELKAVDMEKLSKEQKDFIHTIQQFSDYVSLNFVFYDGDAKESQGIYTGNNTIYININAGQAAGQMFAGYALSHELTHFLEKYAPKEYNALKNFITSHILEISGDTLENLFHIEQEKMSGASTDAVMSEVIANSCLDMLENSTVLAKLYQEDKSLWGKIKSAISKIMENLSKFFGKNISRYYAAHWYSSKEALGKEFAKKQEFWDKAFAEAVKNFNAANESESSKSKESSNVYHMAYEDYTIDSLVIPRGNKTIPDNYSSENNHGVVLENIRSNLNKVKDMDPVMTLKGDEFQKNPNDKRNLSQKVKDFFNSFGNTVYREGVGTIYLNNASVHDSLYHGFGSVKAATFAAIPEVIKNGYMIGPFNYEDRAYDSYLFLAPVVFENASNDFYVGAIVIEDEQTTRYKIHEVLTIKKDESFFKTEQPVKVKTPNDSSNNIVSNKNKKSNTAQHQQWEDSDYLKAVSSNDMAKAQEMVNAAAKSAGYDIKAYHGTQRSDRVGNKFLPERATSGPMAFFTDSREIAESYAKSKADTSLAYDDRYTSYESQFRTTKNGKEISIVELWNKLSSAEKNSIIEKGKHINWDDEAENIIYDPNAKSGNGAYSEYDLRDSKGNGIQALVNAWLNSGDLFGSENRFLDVLKLAGIKDVKFYDPDIKTEKVYDSWLKITKPFDAADVDENFVNGFLDWYSQQDSKLYQKEYANADAWDKNNVSAAMFAERMRRDIANGTSSAWTSIPDSMTNYLKSLGYDGIKDKGGKQGGAEHTVWIPFSGEQVKSADPVVKDDNGNVIPLSQRFNENSNDIRYQKWEDKTPNEIANEETAEIQKTDVQYSIWEGPEPKNKLIGYKVFRVDKNHPGQLYPTKIANPGMHGTPVGVWLKADTGEIARDKNGNIVTNTKGRIAVKANSDKSGTLAWRPGWHLGQMPEANQMNVENPNDPRSKNDKILYGLQHDDYVFCECEFANDIDYQLEAFEYGTSDKGTYSHSQAGIPYIPVNGNYKYRTNANPNSSPWYISGQIKITKILDDNMVREILAKNGYTWRPRQSGKDIDLAEYGLKAGPVIPTSDLSNIPASVDYSEEIKKLPGYKRNKLNWNNKTFQDAFKIQQIEDRYEEYKNSYSFNPQHQQWEQSSIIDYKAEANERNRQLTKLQAENDQLKEQFNLIQQQLKNITKERDNLEKSKNKLTEKNKKLLAEFKATPIQFREDDLNKLASNIAETYGVDKAETKALIVMVANGYALNSSVSYETYRQALISAAAHIIDNTNVLISDEDHDLREAIKEQFSKSMKFIDNSEDELDGGYAAYRKAHFGTIKLVRKGNFAVSDAYKALQDKFGESMFPEFNSEAEKLEHMVNTYEDSQAVYGNVYESNKTEATLYLANEIMEELASGAIRMMPKTYRDKMNEKRLKQIKDLNTRIENLRVTKNNRIAKIKANSRSKLEEAIAKEKAEKWKKVKAVHDYYVKKENEARSRRKGKDYRLKVTKLVKQLNSWLKNPTETKHIPADLTHTAITILEMIDRDTGSNKSIQQDIANMKSVYERYEDNEDFPNVYDPVIDESLKVLANNIGNTPLNRMSNAQLELTYQVLKSLTYVCQNAVKVRIGNEERDAFEVSKALTQEVRRANAPKLNLLKKYLMYQLKGADFFDLLGGHTKNSEWVKLAKMFADAETKQEKIIMMLSLGFTDLVNNQKAIDKFMSTKDEDLVDIGLKDEDGESILVTHDIMLGIYMDLLNEENKRHFLYTGKVIPNLKDFYKQRNDNGFGQGERHAVGFSKQLSNLNKQIREAKANQDYAKQAELESEVEALMIDADAWAEEIKHNIFNAMTDFDKDFLDATQELMDDNSKKFLNETTMEVYGIEKAIVDNYFPIITDKDFLNKEFEAVSNDLNLENVGFMKQRVISGKPTLAMGVLGVTSRQINNVAQYCSMMPAMRTFNKVYGKSLAGYEDSVKKAIHTKFGEPAIKYMDDLMGDLVGGRNRTSGLDKFFSGLRGNLAPAVLTGNPRVALAQTASFPTAAAKLGWKPLAKALAHGGKDGRMISRADKETIAQYSPKLWYRMQGYSSVEIGDIKNSNQLSAKIWKKLGWFTGWIQAFDGATVGRLWDASKYYVDSNYPNLEKDSEEYYNQVAEVYNDVINTTQPVYGVFQRPAVLRDPSALAKSLFMFMTQRLQNFNVTYTTAARYQRYRADYARGINDVTKEDVEKAKLDVVHTATAMVAQGITLTVFKFLADVLLHNMDKYRDDDDELTATSISLKLLDMFIDAEIGCILFGSELYSILKAFAGKESWYGLSVNGVGTLSDTIQDFVTIGTNINSGDLTTEDFTNLGYDVAQAFGIPVKNSANIVNAIVLHFKDAMNGEFLSFEAGLDRKDSQNASLLIKAYDEDNADDISKYTAEFESEADAMSAVKSVLRTRYLDDDISYDEAIDYLIKFDLAFDESEADKILYDWKGNEKDKSVYDDILSAITNADQTAYKTAFDTLKEHGYDDSTIYNKIKDDTQKKYVELKTVSKQEAIDLLVKYAGMNKTDAAAKVQEWTSEVVTGIKYSDIGDYYMAYLNGNKDKGITETETLKMLTLYGGLTSDKAKEKVLHWQLEAKTGIKVESSTDGIKAAVISGVNGNKPISETEASSYMQKYNGKSKEDADRYAAQYAFERDTGYSWSDVAEAYKNHKVSETRLLNWEIKCNESVHGSQTKAAEYVEVTKWQARIDGFTKSMYEYYLKSQKYIDAAGLSDTDIQAVVDFYNDSEAEYDEDGDSISYSRAKAVANKLKAYGDQHGLTSTQLTSLMEFVFGYSTVKKVKQW